MPCKNIRVADGGQSRSLNIVAPFHEAGTASFPGHKFKVTGVDDESILYHRFVIRHYPDNLQIYDPYLVKNDSEATERNLREHLNEEERRKYDEYRDTIEFSRQYQEFTGRPYLANYLRPRPRHFMWPAEYFGQKHWIESAETHYTQMPPPEKLNQVLSSEEDGNWGRPLKEMGPRVLEEYRSQQPALNMTLEVLSVAPRVFSIQNFLSEVEVDHILQLAGGIKLARSTVGNAEKDLGKNASKEEVKSTSRTSLNSWVHRSWSPMIDSIYRRAADLMRIDEALFRQRTEDERPDLASKQPLAEQLQLVHYDPGQEYTAHHGKIVWV